MEFTEFAAESAENYEQKCTCVLVLDISISMGGARIDALNRALQDFHSEIQQDPVKSERLEISIITFNDLVNCVQEPALAENFSMPHLTVSGTTKMVDGVRAGVQKAEARKQWYRQTGQKYYRPWIVMITDGAPDPDQDIDGLASEISAGVSNKKFEFMAVGVKEADMNVLERISAKMPPAPLDGLKFGEFFEWLSNSMGRIVGSVEGENIELENPGTWWGTYEV